MNLPIVQTRIAANRPLQAVRSGPRGRVAPVMLALTAIVAWSATSTAHAQEAETPELQSYLAGNGFLNRGLNDLAAAEYRKFLKAQPQHPKALTARYGLGVALTRQGKFDEAATELTPVVAAQDFEFAAEAGYLLGQCELSRKQPEPAAAAFLRVARGWPKHDLADDAQSGAVEALYQAGALDRALDAAREMTERFADSPLRPRVEYFAAAAEAAQQKYEPAVQRLQSLLKSGPGDELAAPAMLLLAQCAQNAGKLDDAARAYRQLLKNDDAHVALDARFGLGGVLLQRGEFAPAAEEFERVLTRTPEPRLLPAKLARGRAALELGDAKTADALLHEVESAGPDLADEAAYWLAKLDSRGKRYVDAVARLSTALKNFPKSRLLAEMTYDLGVACYQAKEFAKAAEALQTFLAKFESSALAPDALHLLAASHFELKAYADCRADVARFTKSYPDHARASAVAVLGIECEFAEQHDDAGIKLCRAFLDRYPEDEQTGAVKYRLGMALSKTGKAEEAAKLLAEVGGDARFKGAQAALGDMAFDRGEWAGAEATLLAALQRDPQAADVDVTLLRLGVAQERQKKYEAALLTFGKLIEGFPRSTQLTQALFERGQCQLALGKTEAAADLFQQVLARDGDSPIAALALTHLGNLAMQRGAYDAALRHFDALLARKPDADVSGEALFQRGAALMALKRFADAQKSFESLTRDYPNHERAAEASARGAICLARQDRFADAAAALERVERENAARLDPKLLAAARYEHAWCLRKLDKSTDAAAILRELAAGPDSPETRHAAVELAEIHIAAKEYPQATALLKRVLESKDTAAEVREAAGYRIAVCEYEQARYAEAATAFDQFLEAFPQSTSAVSAAFFAGDSHARAGNPRRAAERMATVLQNAKPTDAIYAPALLRCGEAFAAMQTWAKSEQAFADFLERFGDSEQWYQAQFGVGQAREALGRFEEAMAAYRKVVEKHKGPTAARAQFQIGECLFAMNRHDEAARELLKVDILFAYPEWAGALFEAGRCFEKLGKPAEARAQYQRVVEKYAETKWSQLSRERLSAIKPDGPRGG